MGVEMATAEDNQKTKFTKKENFAMAMKYLLCTSGAGLIQFITCEVLTYYRINSYLNVANFLGEKASDYGLAYFIALVLSVVFNFTVNRKFTFKSANNIPAAMMKVLGYYLVFTPLSILWSVALLNIDWNHTVVLLLTMIVNGVTEFLFCRLVVFGSSINTAAEKKEAKIKEA